MTNAFCTCVPIFHTRKHNDIILTLVLRVLALQFWHDMDEFIFDIFIFFFFALLKAAKTYKTHNGRGETHNGISI